MIACLPPVRLHVLPSWDVVGIWAGQDSISELPSFLSPLSNFSTLLWTSSLGGSSSSTSIGLSLAVKKAEATGRSTPGHVAFFNLLSGWGSGSSVILVFCFRARSSSRGWLGNGRAGMASPRGSLMLAPASFFYHRQQASGWFATSSSDGDHCFVSDRSLVALFLQEIKSKIWDQ